MVGILRESLQKALISLETGFSGLDQIFNLNKNKIEKKLKENIPNKILLVAEAIRKKINLSKIHKLSNIDPWFLSQIKEIVDNEIKIKKKDFQKHFMNSITLNQSDFLTKNYLNSQIPRSHL